MRGSRLRRAALCVATVVGVGAFGAPEAWGSIALVLEPNETSPRWEVLVNSHEEDDREAITVRFLDSDPDYGYLVRDEFGIEALPGGGCVQDSPQEVFCPIGAGAAGISVHTNDGNDRVAESTGALAPPASHFTRFSSEGGSDRLIGGRGGDSVFSGTGDDSSAGGSGADVLVDIGGSDQLNGGGGEDELHGGAGSDVVRGGAGRDLATGEDGRDLVTGGPGGDILGKLRIFNAALDRTFVFPDPDPDRFRGQGGRDKIKARNGDRDRLIDCGEGTGEAASTDAEDPDPVSCD